MVALVPWHRSLRVSYASGVIFLFLMRYRCSATRPRVAYGLSHVALPPLRMALSREALLLCLALSVCVHSVQGVTALTQDVQNVTYGADVLFHINATGSQQSQCAALGYSYPPGQTCVYNPPQTHSSKNRPPTTSPPSCVTALENAAMGRFTVVLLAMFALMLISCCVIQCYRSKRTRAVFTSHAGALRGKAATYPPGSMERSSLEAEAADVEAAASDWQKILHDEVVLNARTRSVYDNQPQKGARAYTIDEKQYAANEKSALINRHSAHAFDGAKESMACKCSDGWWVLALILLVLVPLAIWNASTPCEAPFGGVLCLKATPATYTCALAPTAGCCISTPLTA